MKITRRNFEPLAEAIWAKDPDIILVVGDFQFTRKIVDPFNFSGSVVNLTTLAGSRKFSSSPRSTTAKCGSICT